LKRKRVQKRRKASANNLSTSSNNKKPIDHCCSNAKLGTHHIFQKTVCNHCNNTLHTVNKTILEKDPLRTIESTDQKPFDPYLSAVMLSIISFYPILSTSTCMPLLFHACLLSRLLLPLALEADGVVLPRGTGRRHGPPRQEPEEEAAGRRALQRPALERLHAASRSLAAAWQERDEEEQQERGPAEKLRRQEPPPAASLPTAPHAAGW
jgi:hypothetical protein